MKETFETSVEVEKRVDGNNSLSEKFTPFNAHFSSFKRIKPHRKKQIWYHPVKKKTEKETKENSNFFLCDKNTD